MEPDTIYAFTVKDAQKRDVALRAFKDKVLLIVNVASKCGFTPQYKGLEALYQKFQAQGFVVLGFPCNQFGGQEPGDNADIQSFCQSSYGVTFPVFGKIEVNGRGGHPLYSHLKARRPGILGTEPIKWNFTKFLVGRNGETRKRYAPQTKPESLEDDVAAALARV
jgi:glutathione peroxidase